MLNNEKITLMTKLSLYEQKKYDKEIKSSKYFKSDYMTLKMLSSFACVTLAYIMALTMMFMYMADGIITKMTKTSQYISLGTVIILIYIIITVGYMIFSYAFFSNKFKHMRDNLNEYNGDLKTLHRIQELEYDSIMENVEEEEI